MKISATNLMTSQNRSASDWPTANRNRKSSFHSSVMTSSHYDNTKSRTNHPTPAMYDKYFNNQQRNDVITTHTHNQAASSALLRQRLHQRKINDKHRSRQLKPLTVVKQQEKTFCAALSATENQHSQPANNSSIRLYEDLYKKKKGKSNSRLKQKKENSHKQQRVPVYSMSMLHVNEDAFLRHHHQSNQPALNGIRICNFLPPRSMWSNSSLSGGARESSPNLWEPNEDYLIRGDSSSRPLRHHHHQQNNNKSTSNDFTITNTKPLQVTSETTHQHHMKQQQSRRHGSGRVDLTHPSEGDSKPHISPHNQQQYYLYADPCTLTPNNFHFQQRINELNQLQLDTIKVRKM